jgi:hypothetical protein
MPYSLVGQYLRVVRHAVYILKSYSFILRIVVTRSSKTSVYIYQKTRRRIRKAYLNSSLLRSYTEHTLWSNYTVL